MLKLEDIIKGKSKPVDESRWLIRVHHTLMMNYGWIPFEEFTGSHRIGTIKQKIPIVLFKNRTGFKGRIKDILFGREQEIQMIESNSKIELESISLTMPTIMNLLKEIEKDNQDQKRQMEKSKFRR